MSVSLNLKFRYMCFVFVYFEYTMTHYFISSSIDLSNIAAAVYSSELCNRLRGFLATWPPSSPQSHVNELLIATADFERNLESWKIRLVKNVKPKFLTGDTLLTKIPHDLNFRKLMMLMKMSSFLTHPALFQCRAGRCRFKEPVPQLYNGVGTGYGT